MRLASSHKYTLTSSGRRQSSDGGVMIKKYIWKKYEALFVQKWDLWNKTFKNRKIVKKERNVLKSTYYSK